MAAFGIVQILANTQKDSKYLRTRTMRELSKRLKILLKSPVTMDQ